MSTKRINLEDFADEIGDFASKKLKNVRAAVAKGVAKSIPDLVVASPVDTGLYAQSWDFKEEEKSVILGNYAPYAGIIEYGARPFKPPLPPLLAWAKRVLTNSIDPETGHKVETGQPESGYTSAVWALAIHTQKKIEEFGIVPKHVLENALPHIIDNIKDELRKI